MKTQLILALKVLSRRKVFTAISLFGIAMTLAVLMVATAIIDNFISARAPETRLDRTLVVSRIGHYGPENSMTMGPGYGFLDRFVRTLPGAEMVSIYSALQSTALYRGGARIDTMIRRTDGAYWQILDFQFIEGAPYTAADDEAGRHVAVINEDMREKLFDGAAAVGRTLELEGQRFRVVGVVPRPNFTRLMAYSQVWVPIGTLKSSEYRDQMTGSFSGAVLARDRRDIPALQREFAARLPQVPISDPKHYQTTKAGLDTPFQGLVRLIVGNGRYDSRAPARAAVVLAVLAVLFMALPALNLITLNLSRVLERGPEIGVRRAFGAPRSSLVRQFVFENLVVTVIGGAAGFLVAGLFLSVLNRLAPIADVQFALNGRVFLWGMAMAVVFGLLSGVYPAWRMSRLHPVTALRGGS